MNSVNLSLGTIYDAAVATPFLRRLLPGVAREEPVRVDVRVRSYADEASLAPHTGAIGPKTGRLPVGTLLDCYI